MSETDTKKLVEEITRSATAMATIFKTLLEQGVEKDAAIRLTLGLMRPAPNPTPDLSAFASLLGRPS